MTHTEKLFYKEIGGYLGYHDSKTAENVENTRFSRQPERGYRNEISVTFKQFWVTFREKIRWKRESVEYITIAGRHINSI